MPANPSLLDILGYIFGLLIPFWPALFLEALAGGGRSVLTPMLITWAGFLAGWIVARLVDAPHVIRLIPEPLNTTLFFGTGVVLVVLYVIRLIRGEPEL